MAPNTQPQLAEVLGVHRGQYRLDERNNNNSNNSNNRPCRRHGVDDMKENVINGGTNRTTETRKECRNGAAAVGANVTPANALQLLNCAAQTYAWGRVGSNSLVARMKASAATDCFSDRDFSIEPLTPYAELWMGTHPNGMSTMCTNTLGDEDEQVCTSLRNYVRTDPLLHCGHAHRDDLPFLFKVLSIHKVLSIQAHPDKELAQKLHAERPHVYKDPNHKPEMAIALTDDFQAMCGFRSLTDILRHLDEYPELAEWIGPEAVQKARAFVQAGKTCQEEQRRVMQQLFRAYLEASDQVIQLQLQKLLARLHAKKEGTLSSVEQLVVDLALQFPGDSGIVAPLLLNHVKLTKGQSFYIGPNEPHAYIKGEILECMACSDNVVRAGLTPKLKDVDTLVGMLTYDATFPRVSSGQVVDEVCTLYAPPKGVEEFCVEVMEVPPGTEYDLPPAVDSPSVLLTLSGMAVLRQEGRVPKKGGWEPFVKELQVKLGTAAFLSANTATKIVVGKEGVKLARAKMSPL